MDATISHRQDRKQRSKGLEDGPSLYAWLFCIIGMASLVSVAYLPLPDFWPLIKFKAFCVTCLGSVKAVQVIVLVLTAFHVGEAVYAWWLARKVDPANARGWFWQTFVLGFFSLRFLLKRAKKD